MNVMALTGNLCKDLELKYTKNNKPVLENTIAVQKGIKNKETGIYESDFINFVCFEKKAEYLSEYAKKGDKIEITGKLRCDNWKDEDGKYHTNLYVVADSIKILTARAKPEFEEEEKEERVTQEALKITDEDLPF